ncbi:uncharacterized protein LOC135820770 [Sycon ciliatum]|uniref:uncharacterized protein LOC135820770 n=1 Tax=Sycon ciliatum TaxID=27933 RepID=UPI0031F638B3
MASDGYTQLFVSSTLIPNTLSLKVKGHESLQSLLDLVCNSIPDGDCSGLKLYHIDTARWLPTGGDDTVHSFDLMLGGRLDLRSPVRLAKIRFLDDFCKTIKLDESKMLVDVVRDVCLQLDIAHPEELALAVAGDYEAPGHVGKKTSHSSPIGTLSRAGRPLSFNFESPITARKSSPAASPTPTSATRRFTLGRSASPVTLTPTGGSSPVLSPGHHGSMPRSPSQRRRIMSPAAAGAGGSRSPKDSPLLDTSRRSNTFSSGMRDSPASLRISAAKAKAKPAKQVKNFSKKHGLRLNTPWLAPHMSLSDQDVTEEEDLLLMYRMFYWTSLEKGTRRVDHLFMQAKILFLAGEINCSDEKGAQFVALLCQCEHGKYEPEKHNLEWISQQRQVLFPPKYKNKEVFMQHIQQEWKALDGVTMSEGKCLLVQLWATTPLFGYEFFSCAEVQSQKRGLVGISKTRVVFIPHDAKGDEKKSSKFDFSKLTSWSHSSFTEIVRLTFGKSTLQLLLPEYSGVLADCVQCHRGLHLTFRSVPGGLDAEYSVVKMDNEVLSPAASCLQLAIPQIKLERDKSLTFADVYWSVKIGNPLVSEEENVDIRNPGLWHNPIYDKMEELVDERFQFLDDLDIGGDLDDDDDDDAGFDTVAGARRISSQSGGHGTATATTGSIQVGRAGTSACAGSILAPPMQAPLPIQVSSFTSSNNSASNDRGNSGGSSSSNERQKEDTSAPRAEDAAPHTAATRNSLPAAATSNSLPTAATSNSLPTAATAGSGRKSKKEKSGRKKSHRDPISFGEMLQQAGVKDTYSDSDDEEDGGDVAATAGPPTAAAEENSAAGTPTIVVSQMMSDASLESTLWG